VKEWKVRAVIKSVQTQHKSKIVNRVVHLSSLLVSHYSRSSMLSVDGAAANWATTAVVFTARRVCVARTTLWQDVRLSVRLSHVGIMVYAVV